MTSVRRYARGERRVDERDFRRGLLTEEERYQITIDEWTNAKNKLQDVIRDTLDPYGPIAIMAISGSTKNRACQFSSGLVPSGIDGWRRT